MKVNPYLIFDGQCEAALKLYEQVLSGKTVFKMTYGESPAAEHVPKEAHNRIIHAALSIGDQTILASDAPPGHYDEPKSVYVSLHVDNTADGRRIFNSLAENGKIQMPFEKTFWAAGFGQCIDRFGIPWMINCENE